ncbi:MAG: ComF family protein [Terriglobia bacterium]
MPAPSILRELVGSLLAVVSPTDCLLCQQELTEPGGASICRACWENIQPWLGPACEHCGLPFASLQAVDSVDSLCGSCRQGELEFDRARSYGLYTGNLRKAILHLKFHGREYLGHRLGALLARAWEALPEPDSAIVAPVPLHPSRRRERGFNQAELLAKGLVRSLRKEESGLRLVAGSLRRIRATVPQLGLSVSARRENVSGVFSVARPEDVRNRTVVVVDDVMTTGATLSACAAALKRAGASRVLALSLARATPQFPDVGALDRASPIDEFRHN